MVQYETWQLRAEFAKRLSALYGNEVPAYTTLVEVSHEVNRRVIAKHGADAERLGSIDRVTAERHGAIRVGTPEEMSQVARIFGALGMKPVGFYDLRDARPSPVPVVSTAFRPVEREELARNPFRVFTSMLVPQDRRFFDEDLQARLEAFLQRRQLFPDELLALADRAEGEGGLRGDIAERFLQLAVEAFALSPEPVDRSWYEELEAISSVAADIGGVASTHINHLTPRVLDIDDLYDSMSSRGIQMIDAIQGPPRWEGPDVLLRQTSFRALAEPRLMRELDGSVRRGELRVRFGEVEARGVALTPSGRNLYDRLVQHIDHQMHQQGGSSRTEVARDIWRQGMPRTEAELFRRDLGYFTVEANARQVGGNAPSGNLQRLLSDGWLTASPIVYEDFLPRSAAGIFSSNLTSGGSVDEKQEGLLRDAEWISDAIGREVLDPFDLYRREQNESFNAAAYALGLDTIDRGAVPERVGGTKSAG